jgi:hypothetical protein
LLPNAFLTQVYSLGNKIARTELLLWLASPANSLMVGQLIFLDGGAEATVRDDTVW